MESLLQVCAPDALNGKCEYRFHLVTPNDLVERRTTFVCPFERLGVRSPAECWGITSRRHIAAPPEPARASASCRSAALHPALALCIGFHARVRRRAPVATC